MDRNYLAGERTLMAWIRTSLSMISFGFTIGKLGKVIQNIEYRGLLGNTRTVSTQTLAYSLVLLGTVALVAAALQHRRRVRDLHAMGLDHQFSITFIVALVLAAIGGIALSSLLMAL
jgi:putative membrane protein